MTEQKIFRYCINSGSALENAHGYIRDLVERGWRVVTMATIPETSSSFAHLMVVYEKETPEKLR